MATDKPRITITLELDTLNVYRRFAKLSGRPTATVIADMLTEAREHFVQLGVLLQQANAMKGQTLEQQAAFVERLQAGLDKAELARMSISEDLVSTAERPEVAPATLGAKPRTAAKKAANSLIHRHKSPNPLPTRVPAGSKSKKKGGKNAST